MDLSFIIPFYNGKKYIATCIESICGQEVERLDYEIIIVNDCSTDDSMNLVYELQEKYDTIKIIHHTQNKKQGGARNTGVENSQGKYIWFIDQDDFLKKDSIIKLLKNVIDNQLDILQFCFDEVDSNGKFIRKINYNELDSVHSGLSYLENRGLKSYPDTVWSRIYRRDFLLKNKFKFPENRVIFEDYGFALETMLAAKRVTVMNESMYCYRINELSTMEKSRKNYNALYTYHTCISCGIQLIQIADKIHKESPSLSVEIREGGIWRVNQMQKPFFYFTASERKKFQSLVKDDFISLATYLTDRNKRLLNPDYSAITILTFIVLSPILRLLKKTRNILMQ
jgi:glycosyltransferase involved in cell wall biosynthesis